MDAIKNFAKVTASTGYNAAATSIVLNSGDGTKLGAAPFNLVWWNSTDFSDPSDDPNVEIVRVTVIATDTLTITRAQESTGASTKNAVGKSYKLIQCPTAKVVTDIFQSPLPFTAISIVRAGNPFVQLDIVQNPAGTSPITDALIGSSISAIGIRITGDTDRQPQIWIDAVGNNKGAIKFNRYGGSIGAETAITSTSPALGVIIWHGYDGVSTGAPTAQLIVAASQAGGTWTTSSHPSVMQFSSTAVGAIGLNIGMQLGSTGGVFVGNCAGSNSGFLPEPATGVLQAQVGLVAGLTATQAAALITPISAVAGTLTLAGGTSGATVLTAAAVASGTLTLPAATDTVAVLAASQAFTNKTYNGLTITPSTGALTIANGKILTSSNTLTLAGTDGSTLNVGTGGTLGTAAFVNIGTSGPTVPLLNAANTFSAAQIITTNAAASPGAFANAKLTVLGTDAASVGFEIQAFGVGVAQTPNIFQRRFGGTAAAPAATPANAILGNSVFGGWDGAAIQSGALIKATAINLWSGSDRSAFLDFSVTASGAIVLSNQMRLQGSGGLSVGNANLSTDAGTGGILSTFTRKASLVFGSLPTAVAGILAYITDSSTATWGATITGSGTNKVLGWYNGTNWTVVGA